MCEAAGLTTKETSNLIGSCSYTSEYETRKLYCACSQPTGHRGIHTKRARMGCKQCEVNVCLGCFEKHQQLPESSSEDEDEVDSDSE